MVFNPLHPVTFAQSRNGTVYVYQGRGNRPRVYSDSYGWRISGVDAPANKPSVSPAASVAYYVARIDLVSNGEGYSTPPSVTISNGSPLTPATAICRVREGYVSEIELTEYGKGYSEPPTVTLSPPPGLLAGTNTASPASLLANTDDWDPASNWLDGDGDIVEIRAEKFVTLSGMVSGSDGQTVLLKNVGTNQIQLLHASTASSSGNRFILVSGADETLRPDYRALFSYSAADQAWKAVVKPVSVSAIEKPVEAEAAAVVRAHLRGKYRCYYRYLNPAVPEDEGGPLYSNLSPVEIVDCGDGASAISWSFSSPPAGLQVELWRTTSNQATTLFRVARLSSASSYTDSLTDWELLDPDRGSGTASEDDDYRAMPILLPNGELNANRFSPPPDNYAVGVFFQDRIWMAVDTEGGNQNTMRYSEVDEPESMPDVNELILQSNLRSSDYITALIPYAGAMLVMQSRHCNRLTYVAQPSLEAQTYLMAYRGCLNQRCWDIFDGRVYAMDDQGVYSIDPSGKVENLTLGLWDIWKEKIDYSLSRWFTVRADKRAAMLRVCIALKGDGSDKFPTRMLVYSFDYQTWWEERYPEELSCATEVRLPDGQVSLVYGTSSGALRQLGQGLTDLATGSIQSVTITNPGRGYRTPPRITAPGGHGADFECGINTDGQLTGILIKSPGTQYVDGSLQIDPPPEGGVQATATFVAGDGEQAVTWSYKSGCFEYTTDSQDKRGGQEQTRHCSVTYQPTQNSCLLYLETYYNNAAFPRSNVVRRDRGAGFVHSDVMPAAILDMQANPLQEAESHGVARAIFSGRALDDMLGTDRHVSVALAGSQDSAGSVVIHTLDIFGVNGKGE